MATLSGAAVGASVGGVSGALIGMGIPEYEAKQYESKIRDGNLLVAVHTENAEQIKRAEAIFKENKATDIHCVGEAVPAKPK
jgi:uncharacterized membrane protein